MVRHQVGCGAEFNVLRAFHLSENYALERKDLSIENASTTISCSETEDCFFWSFSPS
jgi:hypothetical protein